MCILLECYRDSVSAITGSIEAALIAAWYAIDGVICGVGV